MFEKSNVQKFTNVFNGEEVVIFAPILVGKRYEIKGILSVSGGFGLIYKAIDKRLKNREVLIKSRRYDNVGGLFAYKNDSTRKEQILKIREEIEFEIDSLIGFKKLRESRMPNVNDIVEDFSPSIYGPHKDMNNVEYYYEDKEICNSEPYIIMQMIHGENLGEYIDKGLNNILELRSYNLKSKWEFDVLQYALELATILNNFHIRTESRYEGYKQFYIYQDLKPENIILTNNVFITLLDFGGMTLVLEDEQGNTLSNIKGKGSPGLGTYGYRAPEMGGGSSELSSLDQRVDIYALGATIFHLLICKSLLTVVKNEFDRLPVEMLLDIGYTNETYELVKKCTEQLKEKRFSDMKEVRKAIQETFKAVKARG